MNLPNTPPTPTPHPTPSSTSTPPPIAIAPIEQIIAAMRQGQMVILVDEEDRENEGDLVLAADHVTPEAINFMAKYGRGLICLTLTADHCQRLQLPPMVQSNGTKMGTAFTVSIEAAEGVTTGISAADRAHTIRTAVRPDAQASDLVQPGHVFPLQAVGGGVLMRAGHTEAGCDLAALAGATPSAVICEIMNDDGSMARLPDLVTFAQQHGLLIGTIADLITYRSRHECLVHPLMQRPLSTPWGTFEAYWFQDEPSQSFHLALVLGDVATHATDAVAVRVHEPTHLFFALESKAQGESWSLPESLAYLQQAGRGIAVLLNCTHQADAIMQWFTPTPPPKGPARSKPDYRTHGVGAQILRHFGVHRMHLLGAARRMPSMVGYGLEVVSYVRKPQANA